jgi:hypothetical protein
VRRGEYRRVEEKRGKVRKQVDVPLQGLVVPFTLPLIDDLIHQLKDAHYFTKLDVRWGTIMSASVKVMSEKPYSALTGAHLDP